MHWVLAAPPVTSRLWTRVAGRRLVRLLSGRGGKLYLITTWLARLGGWATWSPGSGSRYAVTPTFFIKHHLPSPTLTCSGREHVKLPRSQDPYKTTLHPRGLDTIS